MTNLTRIQDISWRDLGDHIIILDSLHAKKVHHLEGVSALIWTSLDGSNSKEKIAQIICDEYNVTLDKAMSDLESFIEKLSELKLVKK